MKLCKIESCVHTVFGKGLCKYHYPKSILSKGTGFKKKKKELDVEGINKMREFFLLIWSKRKNHTCEMCGKWLGNEPLSYMFDHILEKSKYLELKYEEENIAYLCLTCHDSKTRGFPSEGYLKKINKTKEIFGK